MNARQTGLCSARALRCACLAMQWGGAAWKTGCFNNAPSWVAAVMRNGFKSPAGILSVAGLFGMPLWLW